MVRERAISTLERVSLSRSLGLAEGHCGLGPQTHGRQSQGIEALFWRAVRPRRCVDVSHRESL